MVSFSGQKRSGKTLCMSMIAYICSKKRKIISSIPKLKVPHHRLKWEDLLTYVVDEKNSNSKTEKKKPVINWSFWVKNIKKDVFVDEIHNLVGHLNFNSKESKCLHDWVSQIGKIQMDSGDWQTLDMLRGCNKQLFSDEVWNVLTKEANFYFNSQRLEFIDVYFRRLSDVHINIHKKVINGTYYVHADFYFCTADYSAIEIYERGLMPPKTAVFVANYFFGLYGTHEITTKDEGYI